MAFKPKCTESDRRRIVVCEENRRKITFLNRTEVLATKVHVDGCEIDDNGERCDYMVVSENGENFIELKGQDIKKAVRQIERTIRLLSNDANNRRCFVISSKCPLSSADIQLIRKRFKKQFRASFEVHNKQHTTNL